MRRFPDGRTVVARKHGLAWWVWLLLAALIALAVIALLLPLLSGNRDRGAVASPTADGSPTGSARATAAGSAGRITDVAAIIGASDTESLIGRRVELDRVQVQAVASEAAFWVGPSADDQVFVVLEEDESEGPAEGELDVDPGQTVSLVGVMRKLPSEAKQRWGLSDNEVAQLQGEKVFVRARRVTAAPSPAQATPTSPTASPAASATETAFDPTVCRMTATQTEVEAGSTVVFGGVNFPPLTPVQMTLVLDDGTPYPVEKFSDEDGNVAADPWVVEESELGEATLTGAVDDVPCEHTLTLKFVE